MPDFSYEQKYGGFIAGIDEAGRGPWAGPVVAAAVILPQDAAHQDWLSLLQDSKKLTAKKREACFDHIKKNADSGIGIASVAEIDRLNILRATFLAMERAVQNLSSCPDFLLVDGNHFPKISYQTHAPALPGEAVIQGDQLSLSVAAASILAKVTRDQIMQDLHQEFPGYGWQKNAGYGTKQHQDALASLGITIHHRQSFAPIKKLLAA